MESKDKERLKIRGGNDINGYRASLKSMDTEETFDLIFYRPIGYLWACLGRRLGVTPNFLTIIAIILGVGSGVAFYFDDIYINLLGAGLLILADSFDSADGQLARMTGNYSRLGRILDGLCGDLWFVSIYFFICLRENLTSDFFSMHPWMIWILAAITGFFHGIQAAMADYYRQFHLYFLKGEEGSELESGQNVKSFYDNLSWRGNFLKKLMMWFYCGYTLGQERRTPAMQQLRQELVKRFGSGVPLKFRERFRKESLPLMKYTNILSFNTRCFALFAAILIFREPWLYFVFELTVLNFVLIYMMYCHEGICKTLTEELNHNDYGNTSE